MVKSIEPKTETDAENASIYSYNSRRKPTSMNFSHLLLTASIAIVTSSNQEIIKGRTKVISSIFLNTTFHVYCSSHLGDLPWLALPFQAKTQKKRSAPNGISTFLNEGAGWLTKI